MVGSIIILVILAVIVVVLFFVAISAFSDQRKRKALDIEHEKKRDSALARSITSRDEWLKANYSVDRVIKRTFDKNYFTLAVDASNQLIILNEKEIPFNSILNVELLHSEQHLNTKATNKKGTLGRAAAGGLIFGGVGAIVGAVSASEKSVTNTSINKRASGVRVNLSDIKDPLIQIFGEEKFVLDVYSLFLAIKNQV